MIRKIATNYALRHQHPGNVLLHVLGLPVTFVVPVVLLSYEEFAWAMGAFVLGYFLQFAGHAIEGNDAGEVILVKKFLGRPYIDIVRPANQSTGEGCTVDSPRTD